MNDKKSHELDVFLGFASCAGLGLVEDSAANRNPPEPDVLCTVDGEPQYFEVSEVLWETSERCGETLAKGLHVSELASRRKAMLLADGRAAEAGLIQTWGQGGYPVLLSLKQALERKCTCKYETHGRRVSLVLYYGRQTPFEPFELLFECRETLWNILSRGPFCRVWIYHHCDAFTITFGDADYETLRVEGEVRLSSFNAPETNRAVIGSLWLDHGELGMMFDAHYSKVFKGALSPPESML